MTATTRSRFHLVVTDPARRRYKEITGYAAWMWVIELTRRDLRNRITHEPDAEVALSAPFR